MAYEAEWWLAVFVTVGLVAGAIWHDWRVD